MSLLGFNLLVVITFLVQITDSSQSQWNGAGCDKETYTRYNGCSRSAWEEYNKTCAEIRRLTGYTLRTLEYKVPEDGATGDVKDDVTGDVKDDVNHACYQDEILETSQAKLLLRRLRKMKRRSKRGEKDAWRQKRAALIAATTDNRWTLPVPYMIDPQISSAPINLQAVMDGINAWTTGTCVTFQPFAPNPSIIIPYVYFYDAYSQCSSYIGRVTSVVPQPIYLGYLCYTLGTVAHEIGHALGLIHEHQRPDRDKYLTVEYANVLDYDQSLFNSFDADIMQTNMLPYDYGSDMHYRSDADSSNGSNTLVAFNSLFQSTIGQREALSFWDLYAVNLAYCSGVCATAGVTLKLPCQHHGYQDPKNCAACRCPDGWGGVDCSQVAPAVNGPCGGTLTANGYLQTVESPFYESAEYYLYGQQCSWLIQTASTTSHVEIQFQGAFGIYSYTGQGSRCVDYLEIRTQQDLGLNGPRYCGSSAPSGTITSVGSQLLVIFKNMDSSSTPEERRGFSFTYHDASLPILSTSTTTQTTTSTRTTTTRLTPPPITTTKQTTPSTTRTTTTSATTRELPPTTPAPLAGKDAADGNQPAIRLTPVIPPAVPVTSATTTTARLTPAVPAPTVRQTPAAIDAADNAGNNRQTPTPPRLTPYPPQMRRRRRRRRQTFVNDDNAFASSLDNNKNEAR